MLTLKPSPPFDFDLSAYIFSGGDKQIRRYEGERYWQVLRVENKLILTVLKELGRVDDPKLSVDLKSDGEITNNDKIRAEEIICSQFNLRVDLNPFYDGIKNDEIMSELTSRLKGLKIPGTPTVFEALIHSIIEQQISLNAAHSMERNLVRYFGDTLKLGDEIYYAFPTSKKLASATIEELRGCGLSMRKAEYIRDISRLIEEGRIDLDKYRKYESTEEIVSELDEIRGIGVWTAELTALRGMQRLDALPADDLGIRKCISHYYCNDREISGGEVRRIAEKWGKWKGLAGFYVIIAARIGINT